MTLITGDVVEWHVSGDQASAIVRDEGDESTFQTIEEGDDYYVIPTEVQPLVGTALDRELFNIAGLVEQGYHDGALAGVPVILDTDSDAAMGKASSAPVLTGKKNLSSVHAVAGTIGKGHTKSLGAELAKAARDAKKDRPAPKGREQAVQAADPQVFDATALAGAEKIWLDSQVEVSLEESVPQTGAPQAWDAGYDGTGMTIAVLDTGIDLNHPDVAGKVVESKDFTGVGTVADGHGHGTHVAATAAGSGAASDGLRKGVAPGADLAIAKVLNDAGSGSTSQIIAGMEWAASLDGVDVINMSLGGGPSDGTDPASQALNSLTEEHGVLFTVAAGNDGPGARTVGYPGTADAALTVGAVDKSHNLAHFSSRGPRHGDWAIKPEITAPGVGIKAARAAGSSMGSPVDQHYTSVNGTSMAAPHVAGAVALLKQQHPDWDPATLKSALVTTATPKEGLTPFQQGGGELSVHQAVDASVVSFPAALNLGYYPYPHTDTSPVTKTLSYTNKGDAAATLTLDAEVKDQDGNPAPAGMLTLSSSEVTLETGASADVTVTLDRGLGAEGLYAGAVIATDQSGQRVRTPLTFVKEEETYELTLEGVQRNGEPAGRYSTFTILDAHDRVEFGRSGSGYHEGEVTYRVPPGTYSVMGFIATEYRGGGGASFQSQALLGDPEVEVNADTRVMLDAREAVEVTIETPYEAAKVEGHGIQFRREDTVGQSFSSGWVGGDWPYYMSPTDQPSIGRLDVATSYELSAPGVWMDLNFPERDGIPQDLAYEVNDQTVATMETAFHADQPDTQYSRVHVPANPWESVGLGLPRKVEAPLERVELYSANETRWEYKVSTPHSSTMRSPVTFYTPGEQLEQRWYDAPRTPALVEGNEHTAPTLPTRSGDTLDLIIYEWGDANPGGQHHFGPARVSRDATAFRLFQDGQLVHEDNRALGAFPVAPGESRIRMELDVARDQSWWTTSTRTSTAWEFDSTTTDAPRALPLLQIDYDIDVDVTNTAVHPKNARGPFTIGLGVRQPDGVKGTAVEEVRAWLSYDDGTTWEQRPVRAVEGGGFQLTADRRGGGGAVSIKVEARDADGNMVEQEVIRAYKLRP